MKTSAARDHEDDAEQDRGPACGRGARPIAGADRVADTHRAGGSDSERNHERDTGHVERDLVRGARDRIERPGQRRCQREHADLGAHLRCGREPEREQPPESRGVPCALDVP